MTEVLITPPEVVSPTTNTVDDKPQHQPTKHRTTEPLGPRSQERSADLPGKPITLRWTDKSDSGTLFIDQYADDDHPIIERTQQNGQGGIRTLHRENVARFKGAPVEITVNEQNKYKDQGPRITKIAEDYYNKHFPEGNLVLQKDDTGVIRAFATVPEGTSLPPELDIQVIDNWESQRDQQPSSNEDQYTHGEPLVMIRQSILPRGQTTPITVYRFVKVSSIPTMHQQPRENTRPALRTTVASSEVHTSRPHVQESHTQEVHSENSVPTKITSLIDQLRGNDHLGDDAKRAALAAYFVVMGGLSTGLAGGILWAINNPVVKGGGAGATEIGMTTRWDDEGPRIVHPTPIPPEKPPPKPSPIDSVPFDTSNGTFWQQTGERIVEAYNKLHGTHFSDVNELPPGEANALEHANMDINSPKVNLDAPAPGQKVEEYSVAVDENLERTYEENTPHNPGLAKIQQELRDLGAGIAQDTINQDIKHAIDDGSLK